MNKITSKSDYPEPQTQQPSFASADEILNKWHCSRKGLTDSEVIKRLDQYGPNRLEETRKNVLQQFLNYFWGPIAWMIEIAALLSALVGHWADFTITMILLLFNAIVGFVQEYQAADAVDALKKQLALKARALRNGQWIQINATELVPGDIIRLRLGDIIPADTYLLEGEYLSVDQSVLTGESLPVDKKILDIAYSGSTVKQGEMIALVSATGKATYFGKTARLVSGSHKASHFQKAVLNIGDYLIHLCIALVVILIVVQLFRGNKILTLLQFALILTVASIPVAMPAVLSVTMAIGAKSLSKMKAIVSRLESVEEMAGIDILCCDKTGTLTKNELQLGDPVVFNASNADELVLYGALASQTENGDAIDQAVIGGIKDFKEIKRYTQTRFVPFDPVRKRTESDIEDINGEVFKVMKGAPQVILELCNPDKAFADTVNEKINELADRGFRTLGVARSVGKKPWQLMGLLPLYDPPREDSGQIIQNASSHGIQVKMITGDNLAIAKETTRKLGLGTNIEVSEHLFTKDRPAEQIQIDAYNGFAQVFPEHKYQIVRTLQNEGHIVGMTGDGVNDAPALKQADVGIAVSNATDAARASADLVLTAPGLSVIIRAVEEARRIFERMNSYAIYRITETIRIMLFMVLSMVILNFYPITAIMIILLALLNDLPIMTIAKDNTWLDPKPVRWNMRRVLTVSTLLGSLGVLASFGILFLVREVFQLELEQIQSVIFLKLVFAGHSTLLVVRTRKSMFLRPYPSAILLIALFTTELLAALVVGSGMLIKAIPVSYIILIWFYCLIWMFIAEWVKKWIYHHLEFTGKQHIQFLNRVSQPLTHIP